MNRELVRTIYSPVALLLLSSCVGAGEKVATMPLYEACLEPIERINAEYSRKYEGIDRFLDIKIERFDVVSRAHKSIIGYVRLEGHNLPMPIDRYANRIKMECYPTSSVVIKNDKDALIELNNELQRNKLRGIEESFVEVKRDEIEVFFHGDLGESVY